MPVNTWVYVAVAGLLAVHLLVAWRAYSRRTDDAGDQDEAHPDTCSCPACGTTNDAQYRFCRACAADLSGNGTTPRQQTGGEQPY
jgi:hypothetical protein